MLRKSLTYSYRVQLPDLASVGVLILPNCTYFPLEVANLSFDQHRWRCPKCSSNNLIGSSSCFACGTLKPVGGVSAVALPYRPSSTGPTPLTQSRATIPLGTPRAKQSWWVVGAVAALGIFAAGWFAHSTLQERLSSSPTVPRESPAAIPQEKVSQPGPRAWLSDKSDGEWGPHESVPGMPGVTRRTRISAVTPEEKRQMEEVMPCGHKWGGFIAGGGGPTVYKCVQGHRFVEVEGTYVPASQY
jgi:hypothetical protein